MANRSKRFAAGVTTAYAAIGVNILYSMASVPLALKYLGKEEFGLWALATQISGYLLLLDFGVSSALTRLVADHKEDVNGGQYGSFLLTGGTVFVIQGLLIAVVGVIFSFFAPTLFSIPLKLHTDFRNVLIIITFLTGLSLTFRVIGAPLWAYQRMDVCNFSAMITLIVGFAALWIGFSLGWGIYSFAWAGIPALIVRSIYELISCWKSGYYPSSGNWGKPSWGIFHQVFNYGKDVLMMSLGGQLVNASQIMIISRFVGLDAAATFAVGTKFYAMGVQLVSKIMESSTPALTEIFIQGETDRLKRRFWNVISLTAFMSVLCACMIIISNRMVITVWTSGMITWNLTADLLLGGLLIATSLSKCFVALFGVAGNYAPVRYIYFAEGCVLLLIAIPSAKHFGMDGVLCASLMTHMAVTLTLSMTSAVRHIESCRKMAGHSIWILAIVSIAYLLAYISQKLNISHFGIFISSPILGLLFSYLGWRYLFDDKIKIEFRNRLVSFTK